MKMIFMFLFIIGSVYANGSQTCIEKIDELKRLKEQRISGYEKTALFLVSGTWASDYPD